LIKKLANENNRKGEQKQRDETRIHSPSYLLLRKTKRRPRRRNHGSKNVPSTQRQERCSRYQSLEELGTRAMEELGTRAIEEPGAGASEELIPDDRLLQKDQDQSQNKEEGFSSRKKNNSPPHDKRCIIVLFFLSLDQGHHSSS